MDDRPEGEVVQRQAARQFVEMAPPFTGQGTRVGARLRSLAGIQSEGKFAEQGLPGPAGGEANPDAACGLPDAGADFEEPRAQCLDLPRAPRLKQLETIKQKDQVVANHTPRGREAHSNFSIVKSPKGRARLSATTPSLASPVWPGVSYPAEPVCFAYCALFGKACARLEFRVEVFPEARI